MKKTYTCLSLMIAVPGVAFGQTQVTLHMSYNAYAAGLEIAQVDAGLGLGPYTYQMNLAYQTTGMAGFFYRGHQHNTASGDWHDARPVPLQSSGEGVWRGQQRIAQIDYQHGLPVVRQLVPPNEDEREAVPESLRVNSIDTLSALAELIHNVDLNGRCETDVRTYDGRRATEIRALTVGEEMLPATNRSTFAGRALRCDFEGRMLSGFLFGDNRERDSKPMHGSAWLAPATPSGPHVPVRMTFETRWFGDATMYLTSVGPGIQLSSTQSR